jgi:hypothetical protein
MYDRGKWHYDGVFPAGQPASQAYVHIGMYLTWLVLRGLVDETFFGRTWLGRDRLGPVKSRKRTACFLRRWLDEALADNMLTDEGAAFSDHYYAGSRGYLRDWEAEFGAAANDYSVPDTWATFDRISPILDGRYRAWVDAGRPG